MTNKYFIYTALTIALLASLVACGGGGGSSPTSTTNNTPTTFSLTSAAGVTSGSLANTYTCDGSSLSPPLTWSTAPSGTITYAVVMSTIPVTGDTKYNWLLYNIPSTVSSLAQNSSGVGTFGNSDDGGGLAYAPPCSQGLGSKDYTFTVYALSGTPNLSAYTPTQVTGAVLLNAIAPITLASSSITLSATRTQADVNCKNIKNSISNYQSANSLSISCDTTYAYFSTYGIQTAHSMMNGITNSNYQVPIAQNFTGTNAWKIPVLPAIASSTTSVLDGPVGVAVNGIPLFNPCKQGGCTTGGDTKVLGELDACNGHAGRADDYHYHAAPVCMMADQSTHYWDTHPIGWALDGFAIFGYYNPDGTTATRDSICGGNTLTHSNAPSGYAYHVTDTSPYLLSCLIGTPSPDLAGQSSKYSPIRTPPGTPATVSNMTLSTGASNLAINGTSTLNYQQNGNTYQVLYTRTSNTCWNFVFKTNGVQTGSESYCRSS